VSTREHRPQRTCLGCGCKEDQSKLIRLVKDSDGELKVRRLEGGRGGYLHPARGCWQTFLKKRSHYRAFHGEIDKGAREKLIKELSEWHGEY
jgi:predicted RNA-binding protein YlxR (DUF448 family)